MAVFRLITRIAGHLCTMTLLLCSLHTQASDSGDTPDEHQVSAGTAPEAASQQLQRLLSPIDSLTGRFEQTLTDADGEQLQQSQGEFWMQRPGKLNWYTQAPFEQRLITNSETLWLYDPDLEQVTVKSVDSTINQSPASILAGNLQDFNRYYEVKMVNSATSNSPPHDEGVVSFLLTPKNEIALFEKLGLEFKSGAISQMSLFDSLGQTTRINFIDTKLNPSIVNQLFVFDAPPGTDILVDD